MNGDNNPLPCKPCTGTIGPVGLTRAKPGDFSDLIAVDQGEVLVCSACGKHFVVWNAANLTFKTAMAVFTAWFGTISLVSGLFALTVLLGLPAVFGFEGRETADLTWVLAAATVIGLACAYFAYSAYIPEVLRQWRLRICLKGRLSPVPDDRRRVLKL